MSGFFASEEATTYQRVSASWHVARGHSAEQVRMGRLSKGQQSVAGKLVRSTDLQSSRPCAWHLTQSPLVLATEPVVPVGGDQTCISVAGLKMGLGLVEGLG